MGTVSRREQLVWALGLGGLFFLVYGPVNAWTATLAEVPSLWLAWERELPFVPWMVVPYFSLDLFFVLAFFATRDRVELHRHGLRVAVAILVSAALFLLFPLRFGFERPPVEGWPAAWFALLGFDLPYNQCPSLHISLSVIVWPLVRRLAEGWRRLLLGVWFCLIAASTLLVYQHHFVDLLGGAVIGLLVLQAVPLHRAGRTPVGVTARRIATRYGLASAFCFGAAALFAGAALWLLWPGISLALAASAYASGRADFLQKRNGRHCAVIWLLFGPWLLGQWLNWALYRRRDHGWAELAPGIYFGRRPSTVEARELQRLGVNAVLDLSAELAESGAWRKVAYHHIPWPDLLPPSPEQLAEAVAFIDRHRQDGAVYLHCTLGYGRSAWVAMAWLVHRGLTPAHAYATVNAHRRVVLAREPDQTFQGGLSWPASTA